MTAAAWSIVDRKPQWTLNPLFLLRIAGLPIDVVDPLRQQETVRWAERVLAGERALAEAAGEVADALADVVRQVGERDRRRLLALRRDVFNRRPPSDGAAGDLAARLPDPAGRLLRAWLDRHATYAADLSQGAAILARETETGRAHLRDVAAHPRLRHGLLLASPSLDRFLPTYLDAPAGPLGKRARRLERTLLEYLYRAAAKTSPFSTFTAVALGRFGDANGAVLPPASVDGPWRGHARLNVAALAGIGAAVAGDARLRPVLPIQLASGLFADRDRIRYVRRTWSPDASARLDFVRENVFYLSQGAVLDDVIHIVAADPGLPYGLLAGRLHAIDPGRRPAEQVDRYLRRLIELGLLTVPPLRVDIHADDPVRAFAAGIDRLATPWARTLASRVDAVSALVRRYPESTVDTRRRLLTEVRGGLAAARTELGLPATDAPATVVYEDVTVPGTVADEAAWRRSLVPSLVRVAGLLPLFDHMVTHRLSLKGFFLARYGRGGRCDDVLRFVHEFHRDYYAQYLKVVAARSRFDGSGRYRREPNWLRLSEVDAIGASREELIRRMAALRPGASDEVVLDDELIDAVTAHLPRQLDDLESRSFFLQLAEQGGRQLGVVNQCYGGLTLMFSRFAHCFATTGHGGLAAGMRQELNRVCPDGAVFAEVTGGWDTTNMNLHPMVTPYQLVCPGDVDFRPPAQRLPVADLSVRHDERTDRVLLHSRSLDTEVIPVYLGFLVPQVLPEVQRTMLLFSRTSMATFGMWGGVDEPVTGDAVRYRPRVRYRDVVLERRTWTVRPAALPDRRSAGDDAAWFLDWQRWRARHGLPRRVFATVDGAASSKPQYVDFDSAFSLTLLEHAARAGRLVTLKEMLPDPDQLWLRSAEGRHVSELTIEITGTTRERSAR